MRLDERTQVILLPKYYLPTTGGVQNFTARLAGALAARGNTVAVCFPRTPVSRPVVEGCAEPPGVTVMPLAEERSSFWRELPGHLHRLRSDALVLAIGLEYPELLDEQLAALRQLRERGHRVWLRITTTGDFAHRVDARRAEDLARLSGLIVLNEEMRRETTLFPSVGRRTRLIPVMVDTERYHPRETSERETLRARHGLPRAERVLLSAGRLDPRKRLDLLLTAFAAAGLEGVLWLVGDDLTSEGRERQRLETLAQKLGLTRVRFTPGVSEDKMPSLLAAADAFVTASAVEGMSNAVLEAASVGLPIVGFAIPGVADIAAALRGAGFFLAPGESGASGLAEALARGMHPTSLRSWRGEREDRLQDLSIPAVVDAYLRAFREERSS